MTKKTDEGLAPERRRRVPGWQSRDILRTGVLLAGLWIFLKLVWFAHPLILTLFLGVLFGLAVEGGVDWLQRFRIPRGIGAALIVAGFFALLVGLGMWMAPTLREQARELRTRLPQAIDKVEEWFNDRRRGMFGLILGGSEVAQARIRAGRPRRHVRHRRHRRRHHAVLRRAAGSTTPSREDTTPSASLRPTEPLRMAWQAGERVAKDLFTFPHPRSK